MFSEPTDPTGDYPSAAPAGRCRCVSDAAPNEPVFGPAQQAAAGVTELFHRVSKLVPEAQELLTVPPDPPAGKALELMLKHNHSQLPVVSGDDVLGAFSFRSYARGALDVRGRELMRWTCRSTSSSKSCRLVQVTAELHSILDALDADDAVLVGRPDHLGGIVTAVDLLRYLYDLAEQFVQLQEIEQGLRSVIMRAVDDETLRECIERSLA